MLTEFASLTLSRQELLEVQEALALRAMVEDDLRREDGLEPMDRRMLLAKIDQLVNASPEQLDRLETRLDEEMWHHAWYAYTDEWAWYRARKDVLRELGPLAAGTTEATVEDLTHRRYHEKFEEYVKEIDMNPDAGGGERIKTRSGHNK
jgi:hypothetical protein